MRAERQNHLARPRFGNEFPELLRLQTLPAQPHAARPFPSCENKGVEGAGRGGGSTGLGGRRAGPVLPSAACSLRPTCPGPEREGLFPSYMIWFCMAC